MDKCIWDSLDMEIDYLRSFLPWVWLYAEDTGYVQVWKCDNTAWLEAVGINGETRRDKFFDAQTAKFAAHSIFAAMLDGHSMLEGW